MHNSKIKWITQTALMLSLLIVLQTLTKPLGQIVTGCCVNAVLAVSVLMAGLYSGLSVALLSPFFAFLFGIGPQLFLIHLSRRSRLRCGSCCKVHRPKSPCGTGNLQKHCSARKADYLVQHNVFLSSAYNRPYRLCHSHVDSPET